MMTILTNIPYVIHFYLIHGEKSLHTPFIERDSKAWTYLLKIHTMSSVTFHTVSIWLTVYLAIFRYCYIKTSIPLQESTKSSLKNRLLSAIQNVLEKACSFKYTMIIIVGIYFSGLIICSPAYFYSTVNKSLNENGLTYFFIEESDLNIRTNGLIFKIMFYTQAIACKFVPCILLVVFSTLLIRSLVVKNRNKNKISRIFSNKDRKSSKSQLSKSELEKTNTQTLNELVKNDANISKHNFELIRKCFKNSLNIEEKLNMEETVPLNNLKHEFKITCNNELIEEDKLTNKEPILSNTNKIKENSNISLHQLNKIDDEEQLIKRKTIKKKNEHFGTTLMLLMVCILFLISELPQSILIFLSIVKDEYFYNDIYLPLGDLLDLIALINSSINFILYCSMSSQFRTTFYAIFLKRICFKKN